MTSQVILLIYMMVKWGIRSTKYSVDHIFSRYLRASSLPSSASSGAALGP